MSGQKFERIELDFSVSVPWIELIEPLEYTTGAGPELVTAPAPLVTFCRRHWCPAETTTCNNLDFDCVVEHVAKISKIRPVDALLKKINAPVQL